MVGSEPPESPWPQRQPPNQGLNCKACRSVAAVKRRAAADHGVTRLVVNRCGLAHQPVSKKRKGFWKGPLCRFVKRIPAWRWHGMRRAASNDATAVGSPMRYGWDGTGFAQRLKSKMVRHCHSVSGGCQQHGVEARVHFFLHTRIPREHHWFRGAATARPRVQ